MNPAQKVTLAILLAASLVGCARLLSYQVPLREIRDVRVVEVAGERDVFLLKGTCPVSSMNVPSFEAKRTGNLLVVSIRMTPVATNQYGVYPSWPEVVFPFVIDSRIDAIVYQTPNQVLWQRSMKEIHSAPGQNSPNPSLQRTQPHAVGPLSSDRYAP
jgi:hypothetical protein